MIFTETRLEGVFILDIERLEDERGFFARSWCEREFINNQIKTRWVQANISFNLKKGTLRGMHYQASPYEEDKLVRCTRGMIYDVIADLRSNADTYKQWLAVKLSAENRRMVYIPKGFAHGFLTLEDNTEIFYLMSEFYAPGYGRGFRWNDPAFGIHWPEKVIVVSGQDQRYPDFTR
jgi:dTDP-4-dehydrorhamnose 3,5-epimerase